MLEAIPSRSSISKFFSRPEKMCAYLVGSLPNVCRIWSISLNEIDVELLLSRLVTFQVSSKNDSFCTWKDTGFSLLRKTMLPFSLPNTSNSFH